MPKYIAYTYSNDAYRESGAHDTREAAAIELFGILGKRARRSVETAEAVQSHSGHWRTHGKNIQPVRRDQCETH